MPRQLQTPHPQAPQRFSTGAPVSSSPSLVTIDPVRLLRRYWPLLVLAVIVGGVLGVGAHIVLARLAPSYSASVIFLVEAPTTTIWETRAGWQGTNEFERFAGTQVAQMTSDVVLQSAVNSADVINGTEWAKPYIKNGQMQTVEAARALSKSVSASQISMTDLIRLNMRDSNPVDSATIANAIATAYLQDLNRTSRQGSGDRRNELGKRLTAIETELRTARGSVSQILEENNVTGLTDVFSQEEVKMRLLNESIVEASKTQSLIKSLLEKGEKELSNTQAITYPPDVEQMAEKHPLVADLTNQIASMRVDIRALRERGFGEDHPAIQQIKDRIRAAEIELEKKKQEILRQTFTAQLDDYRTQLRSLQEQETKLRDELVVVNKRRQDLLNIKLQKDKLDKDIERLTAEQDKTRETIQNLETLYGATAYDRVKIRQRAQTPDSLAFPRLIVMVPLSVVLMAGLVTGLVVLREILDQRVRGPADLSVIPRMNILGMVPEIGEDPTRPKAIETAFRDNPSGVVTESFRQIRSLLHKRMTQINAKSLVVIGGMPGSGATSVVSNLGMAMGGLDERVLLIDGNLRRPSLHKVFKVSDGPGLGDILSGQATIDSAVQETTVPNVSVLTAGTSANRALPERLGSEAMARLLSVAGERYDRIIIDSSPAIVSGDGLALANRCDAVLLVVKALHEKRGLVNRLRSTLNETRAEFVGVVVNAVRSSAGGYFRKNIEAAHKYQSIKD